MFKTKSNKTEEKFFLYTIYIAQTARKTQQSDKTSLLFRA